MLLKGLRIIGAIEAGNATGDAVEAQVVEDPTRLSELLAALEDEGTLKRVEAVRNTLAGLCGSKTCLSALLDNPRLFKPVREAVMTSRTVANAVMGSPGAKEVFLAHPLTSDKRDWSEALILSFLASESDMEVNEISQASDITELSAAEQAKFFRQGNLETILDSPNVAKSLLSKEASGVKLFVALVDGPIHEVDSYADLHEATELLTAVIENDACMHLAAKHARAFNGLIRTDEGQVRVLSQPAFIESLADNIPLMDSIALDPVLMDVICAQREALHGVLSNVTTRTLFFASPFLMTALWEKADVVDSLAEWVGTLEHELVSGTRGRLILPLDFSLVSELTLRARVTTTSNAYDQKYAYFAKDGERGGTIFSTTDITAWTTYVAVPNPIDADALFIEGEWNYSNAGGMEVKTADSAANGTQRVLQFSGVNTANPHEYWGLMLTRN